MKNGVLWRSIRRANGDTWSAAEKTGLTAISSASHLLCARSGTLVVTLKPGPVPLRFPLHLRLSRDEGITWSEPILLADRPANTSGGSINPELTDGTYSPSGPM